MKTAIKFAVVIGTMVLGLSNTFAFEGIITCQNPTGSKVFTINNNSVSFEGRTPSSELNARTKKVNNGITQILFFEGQKHIIHIENLDNFNEVDDYLWVFSREGHKFLNPIKCSKITG